MHLKHSLLSILFFFVLSCNSTSDKTSSIFQDSDALNMHSTPRSKSNLQDRSPLLVSYDFGESWKSASANLPKDLQASFIELKENELVLASDNMGIYLSTHNKTKWKNIGGKLPNNKINALYVDGENIYAAVYQKGIYHTTDDGNNWIPINYDLRDLKVQSILKWNKRLFIGTDSGIFILDQDSNSWKATNIKSQVLSIYEFDNKLVAGTSLGTCISKDGGNQWKWIRKQGAVHYTHHIGKRIIELLLNGDVIYTDDWGNNWINTIYSPRRDSYVYEIIKCGNYQILSNNYGIHRSQNNGISWEHLYETESEAFFDLLPIGDIVYGGTRTWDEFRKRN